MRKNISLFMICLISLNLGLSACSKNEHKSSGGNPSGGSNPPDNSGSPQTGDLSGYQFSNGQYTTSYQFIENGCDTGKHDFTGTDKATVQKQLCAALQDDQVNQSCAANLRQQYYLKKCVDSTSATAQATTLNGTQGPNAPVAYEFVQNGCDTGYHDFTNPDPEVALQLLCSFLQENQLNFYCAEESRHQMFTERCGNLTWEPQD